MTIPLNLHRSSAEPLQKQIYGQMRELIVKGCLAPHTRLPSSRELALDLGISRNTVLLAYERLRHEGYIRIAEKVGVFVAGLPPDQYVTSQDRQSAISKSTSDEEADAFPRKPILSAQGPAPTGVHADPKRPKFDFWYGRFDRRNFPLKLWRRLLNENLSRAGRNLSEYGLPNGCIELREAIATHLGLTRRVMTTADRIVITAGAQDALNLVARLLVRPGIKVVVENPCYGAAALLLESFNAEIVPIEVDEHGLDTARLPGIEATLAYLTPSHQFPTGATMPIERRQELLSWARAVGAYIVEDDYDSEFRYDTPPLPALAGIDQDQRVIYVGSFSKSIGAGVRVGYVSLPEELVAPAIAIKTLASYGQSWLDQIVISDFITRGNYAIHIRELRYRYEQSRNALLSAMRYYFGPDVQLFGQDGGMHVMWRTDGTFGTPDDIAKAAAKMGVGVYTLPAVGVIEYSGSHHSDDCLILGYSSLRPDEVTEGISRLAKACGKTGSIPTVSSGPSAGLTAEMS